MSDLKQRKPAPAADPAVSSKGKHASDPSAKSKGIRKTSCLAAVGWALVYLVGAVGFALSVSKVTTGTYTFGQKLPNVHHFLPRPTRKFTPEELAQYDGSDPDKPVYIAIRGKVFDVTAGQQYYGKGGGYSFFAGVDASRAYVTGCFKTHLTHDVRGLTEGEIKSIDGWADFYETHEKYFYVGEVIHDPIPEDAPLPEPC